MKKITLLFLSALAFLQASGQKLPVVQKVSVKAPASIKIDGKAKEWGNKFEAYNNATQIYYTLANDTKNLYLIVKATDALVARKILAGSITLEIKAQNQKSSAQKVAITFPSFDKKPNIDLKKKPAFANAADNAVFMDAFMSAINNEFEAHAKFIGVSGIANVADTVISIYNAEDIKAAARFDNDISFIYELSIPIRYLKSFIVNNSKLSYNIKLKGSTHVENTTISRPPSGGVLRVWKNTYMEDTPSEEDMLIIAAQTNLSGEYTLAK